MRRPVDAERIRRLMRELGYEAETDVRLYFTGGATAVLFGWRSSTIDVDVKLEPPDNRELIEPLELRRRFEEIAPLLYRYPAIDSTAFRRALEEIVPEEGFSEPEI